MAVTWGSWEYSGGNGMRVGLDVDWESVTHGESGATATIEIWTENQYTYSDDQKLSYGGSLDSNDESRESKSFTNNDGGSPELRDTVHYTYTYSGSSYGYSPATRTFTASLSGAFNGVTPSVSHTSNIPSRPFAAPAAPTSARVTYVSDDAHTVWWYNHDTTGEPWDSITLQRRINGGAWSTITSSISGNATSYTANPSSNSKYEYQVRANNDIGSSSYAATSAVWTTPSAPTGAARSGADGATQVITWTNTAGYSEYETEVWVSQNDGAYTLLATKTAGTVTHSHTGPPAATSKWKYKVRHKTTSGTVLYSSFSSETSQTVGTVTPPNAPISLAPDGYAVDPSVSAGTSLTWTHSPTDASAQTAFNIRHRVAGTSTWTTGSGTTVSAFNVAANTYGDGVVTEWQVQTRGTHASYGEWSASATYTNAINVITPKSIKLPAVIDLITGDVEASTTAYEVRDYTSRTQAQLFGGGVRAVNVSYGISWSQRFIAISMGRGAVTFPGGYHDIVNPVSWTVTNKVLTSNIATLTIGSHKARVGESIIVSGVDATFNGTFTVRSTTTTTVSYDKVAANVGTVASGGNVGVAITGHGGAASIVPSTTGIITLPSWNALYYDLPFGWGAGTTPKTNGVVSVTNKVLTTNVATLTVVAPHYFAVGDFANVAISDAVFDGLVSITGVTATTISYAKVNANVASTPVSSGVVRPYGSNTFNGNFHVVSYSSDFAIPSTWLLLAMRNGDALAVEWATGDTVNPGFDSASPVLSQVILSSTSDAAATAGNKPALRVGDIAAAHLRIDGNEIIAMASDSAVGTLYFQNEGGDVKLFNNVAGTADTLTVNGKFKCNNIAWGKETTSGVVGVQSATVSFSSDAESGNGADFAAISGNPYVFVCIDSGVTSVDTMKNAWADNTSATGFTLRVERSNSSTSTAFWLAIKN